MTKILGIHDGHNSAACLLENGKIKWLIQEERLRHEKNYSDFPELSIKKILELENLQPGDIDHIVFNGHYMPKAMNRQELLEMFKKLGSWDSLLKNKLKSVKFIDNLLQNKNKQDRLFKIQNLGFDTSKADFIGHHLCHASSAYYGFGDFDKPVLILTNDGAGDRVCATISIGRNGRIDKIAEVHENNSIGLLYGMFTFLTGMVPLEHEYKIMGMAPYADYKRSKQIADEFHNMFEFDEKGLTWKFKKGYSIYSSLNFFREFMYLKRFDLLMGGLQIFTEEFMTRWVQNAIKHTGIHTIALSGGTFMNVKANKAIMELPEVHEVFVFPSCGDESSALGAAYNLYAQKYDHKNIEKLGNIYWGVRWDNEVIENAFKKYSFKQKYTIKKFDNIEQEAAKILAEGNVLARFKGREEFGARSLGNRAILANPSKPEVIKEINELIKSRDFWMPFASSILDINMDKYVNWDKKKNNPYYMIMTYDTNTIAHHELSGGIHPYDKTVRPQMVTKEHNPDYWNLIKSFEDLTGIGGIMNTSLNLHGLPLVYSPEDAFEVLERSKLKYLAIENYLITKE